MVKDMQHVDVLVIGGGVVGSAILRELARYDAHVALLERNPDVCEGTSKSNSAIVHTGFDAPPGTLEVRLLADARALWPQIIEQLHIPYLQTGALLIATSEEELATLHNEMIPKAERNGVMLQPLTRDEILENAPYINPAIVGGALVEGEGIIDPFWTTRAYCENAILNGAQVFTSESVVGMSVADEHISVHTSAGRTFAASLVINAAGLWSDEVARLIGDHSFTLTPRKGQFIIVEEDHGVSQIILPIPNRISKGILVTPIIFGGVMLGPTAEEVQDKGDFATTSEGLRQIRQGIAKLVPAMTEAVSVRQFAGLRAVSSTGEYIIRPSTASERLLHVAGIRSTGLSASPAIGRYVGDLARDQLGLALREHFVEELPEYLSETHANEGDVICLCRSITHGEIMAALRSPLPPETLDGLKRRTGAMLGDCQGNICMPRLMQLFQQQRGCDPLALNKNYDGSSPVVARVAGREARR